MLKYFKQAKTYTYILWVVLVAMSIFFFYWKNKNITTSEIQQTIQIEPDYVQDIVETEIIITWKNESWVNNEQEIKIEPVSITTEDEESITQKLVAAWYKPKETKKEIITLDWQKTIEPIKKLEWTKSISVAKNKQLPVSVVLKSTNTLQNNYAEAELPVWVYVKDENNISYEREIEKPKFVDPKEYNIDNKEAVAMIDVWSDLESIFFSDENWNPEDVIIRIPAPWYKIWSDANIYSSEDGKDWKFHTTAVVQNIENAPYVEFSTTHFTLFAVGSIQNGIMMIF